MEWAIGTEQALRGIETGIELTLGALAARQLTPLWLRHRPKKQLWKDWCQHTRIQGYPGGGKSTLLAHMAAEHMRAGRSVFILDPHGPLARDVLAQASPTDLDRVIYHRPAGAPLGMNPLHLETGTQQEKELVVDNLLELLRMMTSHWGPKQEDQLEHALNAVLARPAPRLAHVLDLVDDVGLASRLRRLVANPTLEAMIDTDPVPFAKLMNAGAVYLLDLSGLGNRTRNVVYALHTLRIQQAAMTRSGRTGYRGVFVVADEAQRVASRAEAFEVMLEELRKCSVALALAHHDTSQMPADLTRLYGLIANQYLFRLTPEDARKAETIAAPIEWERLTRLPNYRCLRRRQVRGYPERGAIVRTKPPLAPVLSDEQMRQVEVESAKRYGVNVHATNGSRRATDRVARPGTGGEHELDHGPLVLRTVKHQATPGAAGSSRPPNPPADSDRGTVGKQLLIVRSGPPDGR